MSGLKTSRFAKQQTTDSKHPAPAPARPALVPGPRLAAVQRAVADHGAASPADILALQQTHGNRATQRLLARRAVQAKLTVGPVGDKYEQEADRVANQVMRMPAPGEPVAERDSGDELHRKPLAGSITPLVQRDHKPDEDEEVQTKRSPSPGTGGGFEVGGTFESQLSANGGGAPLPAETRAYMEPRFGADFGGVRIHADGSASKLARSVDAQAFTHGQDIYMGEGKFQPRSDAGRQLLAHELTHVVQQTGSVQRKAGAVKVGGGMDASRISRKKVKKQVDFIKMKRKETHIVKMLLSKIKLAKKPDDAYGHWWTELGGYDGETWTPLESYGWWPSQGMDIKSTLKGVAGDLNGKKQFGGSATKDPHHGDDAKAFHPVMTVDDTEDYKKIRDDVFKKVRSFAAGFKGSWNWRLGWGKNCHTFQERLMKAAGFKKESAEMLKNPSAVGVSDELKKAQSTAAFEKVRKTFEDFQGGQFYTLETIQSTGMFSEDDLRNALDTSEEEKEARIKTLLAYDTGVADYELKYFADKK